YLYELYTQLPKITRARTWSEFLTSVQNIVLRSSEADYNNTDAINKKIEKFANLLNKFINTYASNLDSSIVDSYNSNVLELNTPLKMQKYTIDEKVYNAGSMVNNQAYQELPQHKKDYVGIFAEGLKTYKDLEAQKKSSAA